MNEFVTLDLLATFAGMSLVVGLLVQFSKGLFSFSDRGIQMYAYVWALVLVSAVYINQGLFKGSWEEWYLILLLAVINAAVVALAAIGGYEVLHRKEEE